MSHVKNELKKIHIKILNSDLPIWEDNSFSLTQPSEERLDNNYWSASYYSSLKQLEKLEERGIIQVMLFSELIDSVISGIEPNEDGDVPLIEGNNIRPNLIYPMFEKFTSVQDDESHFLLNENDIILTKDGMPGAFSYVSAILLKTLKQENQYKKISFSSHVYRIKLKKNFKDFAPYVTEIMNSRIGQALTRRFISGSVTPTLRKDDVKSILIPIPKKNRKTVVQK